MLTAVAVYIRCCVHMFPLINPDSKLRIQDDLHNDYNENNFKKRSIAEQALRWLPLQGVDAGSQCNDDWVACSSLLLQAIKAGLHRLSMLEIEYDPMPLAQHGHFRRVRKRKGKHQVRNLKLTRKRRTQRT